MKKKKRICLVSAAVGVAIIVGSFLVISNIGRIILPDIELNNLQVKDVENRNVSLNSYVGKPFIVEFWATWCPPCRKNMPLLQKLQSAHANEIQTIGISDEAIEKTASYKASNNLSDVVFLQSQATLKELNIKMIPACYLFDASGKCIEKHVGELSYEKLESWVKKTSAN